MDAKILAAVLASLAAVFAGTSGGMFSTSDVRQVTAEAPGISTPSSNSLLQKVPVIGGFFEKPVPKNDVKARITVQGSAEVKINSAMLEAQNLTRINSRSMKIDSDQEIQFKNFNGKVRFGNTSKISGAAAGLKTSGVNLTTDLSLDTEVQTHLIRVENTVKTPIKFKSASVAPAGNSDFPINTQEKNLNINSFTGDIMIYPGNSTLVIDGKVATLTAGKTTYGGN
ncbi:MAG: hypothetical protein ABEK16_00110 [Candidatus Nanohalobium sp.]